MEIRRIGWMVTVVAVLALGVARAEARDAKVFQFTNNSGQPASDLHVRCRFTGGNLKLTIIQNAPGCPPPAIPSNGKVTNTGVVDWGQPCVAPGAAVIVRFDTDAGPLEIDAAWWTAPGQQEEPGIGRLDPERDIVDVTGDFPGPPPVPPRTGCAGCATGDAGSAGVLVLLLATVAILIRGRRRDHRPEGHHA